MIQKSLDIIFNFLSLHSDGRTKEFLSNTEQYICVKQRAKLQTYDTTHLINMYYQKMANLQKSKLHQGENGKIYCTAYYVAKSETLVVQGK